MKNREEPSGWIPLRDDHPRQRQADSPSDKGDGARFQENEREHAAIAESERFQHPEFADSFADGLGHRIPGNEQNEAHDDGSDGDHDRPDVAYLLGPFGNEHLLGRSFRLRRRVFKHRVDALGDLIGDRRIRDADYVPPDDVLETDTGGS